MQLINRSLWRKQMFILKKYGFHTKTVRKFSNDRRNYVLTSVSKNITIPTVSIPELIYSKIEPFHKYTAMECAITGKTYTYEDIVVKSKNFSKSLRKKLKLKQGDVVALLLPNIPEYPIAVLGILGAGLVITPLNPSYSSEEIARQLKDSAANLILTETATYNHVVLALNLNKQNLPIVTIKCKEGENLPGNAVSFEELINVKVDIPDIKFSDSTQLACLPYSSGTTGLPKGVELTHHNIVSNICQAGHQDFCHLTPTSESHQDVTPIVLPLCHIYGISIMLLNTIGYGAKLVTMNKFSPDIYLSVLKKNKISLIYAAPPLVLFLTQHPEVKAEYLKHIKQIMCGAAPLGQLDEDKFAEKIGHNLHVTQGYGMTEASPGITCMPKGYVEGKGSIGKPYPNTLLKVIRPDDETGIPLGPMESGELLIKGPQVMEKYHDRPEATEKAFLNGWLRSGDIVHYNEERFLFITDRLKDLIKVKGYQVAPAELEEIIRDIPSVEDAAVIGIPHKTYGEVPRAYVVLKKNRTTTTMEVETFVAKKVVEYKKLLGGVKIVDVIPKNASGKTLRRQLKSAFEHERI